MTCPSSVLRPLVALATDSESALVCRAQSLAAFYDVLVARNATLPASFESNDACAAVYASLQALARNTTPDCVWNATNVSLSVLSATPWRAMLLSLPAMVTSSAEAAATTAEGGSSHAVIVVVVAAIVLGLAAAVFVKTATRRLAAELYVQSLETKVAAPNVLNDDDDNEWTWTGDRVPGEVSV
ncbi:hypothetical protein SPRG_07948 [Saprolegnia parasitica CBS 223.65]|uniref:Transmembrane protein n=1 Tax=Saprolegnia parasitica (strain CBS 223.65) TaxID=695850 RepID=A0A067CJ08_SAPPC|nr:hypothetical protein SPRG_07948 [Saprolegnia parasitica CBS 223.65]KDO26546.1 hypothetical protein SPRG_07948 [Saprolegnia parasitica CBS 223.65]|eukprot:XP_012202689.1 hypothetical protein SPRG_07948 [Saprolegnia parasitica CBS 223.65]